MKIKMKIKMKIRMRLKKRDDENKIERNKTLGKKIMRKHEMK